MYGQKAIRILAVVLAAVLVGSTLAASGVAMDHTDTETHATETPYASDGATEETDTETNDTETDTETETEPEMETPAPEGETPAEVDPQQQSSLRLAHAAPDAPAVDVYLDNESVLAGASFSDVSAYQQLPAGTYNVTVTAAGDRSAVVLEETLTVETRTTNTVAVAGELAENRTDLQLVRYLDDAYEPADDRSAISVAHLSPDAPAVDVTANNGSTVLANNISYREASEYVTVPAGNYTVEVRAATGANDGPIVAEVDVDLEGGTAYSALALGYLDPEQAPADTPFSVELVEDATTTVQIPDNATES